MEFELSSSQSRILLAELDHSGTLAYHLYFKRILHRIPQRNLRHYTKRRQGRAVR